LSVFEHPAWGVIQTIFAFAAVIIAIIIFLKQRQKKEFSYEIISDMPLIVVGEETEKGKLEIRYEGKEIEQAYTGIIKVFNSGNVPIDEDDFASPVAICSSETGQILTAEIVEREPDDLQASIDIIDGEVVLSPTLINGGDALTLRIICTTPCTGMIVKGRIKGVKRIKKFTGAKLRYWGLSGVGLTILLVGLLLPLDFFIPPILITSLGALLAFYGLSKVPK
jgi:hypothetical protein